jgi:hypothetical protein
MRAFLRNSRERRERFGYAFATIGAVIGAIISFPRAFDALVRGQQALRSVEGGGWAEFHFVAYTLGLGALGWLVGQVVGGVVFAVRQRWFPPRVRL